MSKYHFEYVAPLAFVIAVLLGPSASAQNGSTTANYAGSMDHAGCDSFTGWAADLNQPNTPIQVSILSDGQPIASVAADLLRSDVGSAIGDNGMHGFSWPTPATLLDGNTHNIQVMFGSSASNLPHTPVTLACTALPLPPVCADIFITTTPLQGPSSTHSNHYCRDRYGRTRYDDGRFSTIDDLSSQIVLDNVSQTYTAVSWNGISVGSGQAYAPAYTAELAASAPPPPPRTSAGCPTGNEGWSAVVHPPNAGGAVPDQLVDVWACPSLALPMYVRINDPVLGTTELDYDNIVRYPEPDPGLFTVPSGYSQNPLLSLSSWATSCAPQTTLDPVIVVTTNAQPGRAVMTSLTNGYAGCSFVDSTITVGPSLNAFPLTTRNLPIFQLLVLDNQNSQYTNSVDFGRVTLVTDDGLSADRLIIRLAIH